jgi:hypothetical protein
MIDVHDMMIGNWYHDDKYDAITTLTPNLAYQHILNTCSGIPVTVDMLKRIGFEEYEDLLYCYWDKDRKYKLEVCVDEDWCNSGRKFSLFVDNSRCVGIGSAEFTYVHELQNLVRIISGFSLPITKEMLYE